MAKKRRLRKAGLLGGTPETPKKVVPVVAPVVEEPAAPEEEVKPRKRKSLFSKD